MIPTPETLPFVTPGRHEHIKGAVHGAMFTLACMCALYNVSAWMARREPRLAANGVLYGLVAIHEAVQVLHHAPTRARS